MADTENPAAEAAQAALQAAQAAQAADAASAEAEDAEAKLATVQAQLDEATEENDRIRLAAMATELGNRIATLENRSAEWQARAEAAENRLTEILERLGRLEASPQPPPPIPPSSTRPASAPPIPSAQAGPETVIVNQPDAVEAAPPAPATDQPRKPRRVFL